MNSFLKGCEAVGTVRLACRWIARAALALSTIILLAPDADAGRLRQATESRVAMEIPESFIQSYRFVGFADAASGASFQILDLRGEGYESWKAGALRAIPREERFVEPPQIRELPGRMGEYQYTVNEMMVASVSNHLVNYDQPIVRYSFVFREGAFAAKIVAKVPKGSFESGAVTQEQIERVFVSATMGEQKEAFRLGYVGDFARSSLDRKGLPYPKNYYLANQRNTWFIVSVREQGPRGAPLPVIGMDWKLQSGEQITIAGLQGRERFGTVTHWRDRTPYKAYLIEVFDGGRIYTMVGLASAENMPKYLPEFKKMAASFQPLPAD